MPHKPMFQCIVTPPIVSNLGVFTGIIVLLTMFSFSFTSCIHEPQASANSIEIPYIWTFGGNSDIPGWVAYDSNNDNDTVMRTNAKYLNGMTITASNISAETGSAGMRWLPNETGNNGLMRGALQPNSAALLAEGATFVRIEPAQGPFEITLNYTSTGITNAGRYATLYIDGIKVADGEPTPNEYAASTLRQLVYEYTGNNLVTIDIGANSPIRLYEVVINKPFVTGEIYYLWEAAASDTFTITNDPVIINGKTWRTPRGGATVPVDNTGITLSGERFTIGTASNASNNNYHLDGEFDFSSRKKLTIVYSEATSTDGYFQIALNYNQNGGPSDIRQLYNAYPIPEGDIIEIIIEPFRFTGDNYESYLQTAYLQFLADRASVNITKIMIENFSGD